MDLKAICLVTFKPNEIYLDFFKNFIEYDIYIIIDDITFDSTELKLKYPTIDFIQIKNQDCLQSGFTNTSTITLQKPVVGWDKALYFFSYINNLYDYIWFMEDDIYFYDENTLKNIDKKYENNDILCNSSFTEAKLDEWLWNIIHINLPTPYYCGMMCVTRFSKNMIESIKDYAIKNNTLFFLEALYPTIAVKYNLKYLSNLPEFLTVTHREIHDISTFNKSNLYHPVKNLKNHVEVRNNNK